jgi:hypothetical protein
VAAQKSALSDYSVRPPYFIKNPVAVSGSLDRLRGFAVALKILAQSGTVSDISTGTGCMPFSAKTAIRFAAFFAVTAIPLQTLAQPSEPAPTFVIEKIPASSSGDNHDQKPVMSDGLRIYTLTTHMANSPCIGDHMLRMRVNELAALYDWKKSPPRSPTVKPLLDADLARQIHGRSISSRKRQSAIP